VTDEETGQEYVETVIRRAIVGTNTRSNESTILGVVELDKDEESKKYEVQTVRSEYLIATDGGKSAVRHQLDIAFPGRTLHNCIILLDCKVDSPIPLNNISFLTADDNHRIMAVFPLHDNHVRILIDNGVLTPEEHSKLDSNTLTLEMCQELVNECTGATKFILSDPTWLTYYRVNERLAEHYSVKNRVFLAGDAAHVHSPAGGQGMNTGLQDSFNLTWKMGLVLDGLAPASILSSYEVERKPVAAHVIDLSSRGINFGLAQEFWKKMMRRLVISIAPYVIPYVGNLAPNTLSMNTKAHRDVPVLICGAGPTGLFAAILLTKLGHRCRIIERHHEISPLSKALVIHARTMEIFAMTGILDPFLEQGSRVTELHAYIGGERKAVLHALQSNESAYSFGLFLEQRKTTAILTEALEKLGVSVDRGWELASTKVVTDEETGQ
ncbi:hypothetical protein BGZ94_005512, partial [Podila epigama]